MGFFGVRKNGVPLFQVGSGGPVFSAPTATIVAFKDAANSTYADLQVRDLDFRQPASTFAGIATMTNGPRAANPVAWVEVAVAGSTGRIPVW